MEKYQKKLRNKYRKFVKSTDKNFRDLQQRVIDSNMSQESKEKIGVILYQLYPAYLAPSIMLLLYNTRFDLHSVLKNDKTPPTERIYNLYRTDNHILAIRTIFIENILHTIRILIERIGLLLNIIHPEIITNDGFGFINNQNPLGKGVLKYALSHQHEIHFMKELLNANNLWISKISKSDNYIKHKDSLNIAGQLTIDKDLTMPIVIPAVVHDKKQNIHYESSNIDTKVNQCYDLTNKTIQYVITNLTEQKLQQY